TDGERQQRGDHCGARRDGERGGDERAGQPEGLARALSNGDRGHCLSGLVLPERDEECPGGRAHDGDGPVHAAEYATDLRGAVLRQQYVPATGDDTDGDGEMTCPLKPAQLL